MAFLPACPVCLSLFFRACSVLGVVWVRVRGWVLFGYSDAWVCLLCVGIVFACELKSGSKPPYRPEAFVKRAYNN